MRVTNTRGTSRNIELQSWIKYSTLSPTVTDLVQNLDEMNCVKSKDSKKYEWAATGCGVRIKLKN